MSLRRAALASLAALLLAAVRAQAGQDCVPQLIPKAIRHSDGARVVRLGPIEQRREGLRDDGPGRFMGCPSLESFEISGAAARSLREAFGSPSSYACESREEPLPFGRGSPGVVGIEFETGSSPVRILIHLSRGAAEVGFAGGVRFPAQLKRRAYENWQAFLERFAEERHRSAEDFLAAMVESQQEPADDGAGELQENGVPDCSPPVFGKPNNVTILPVALARVSPRYPDAAREAGVDGTVIVWALVGCDGRVIGTRVGKSIPMLDAAAREAVEAWTFKPGWRADRVVACWTQIPVKFSLH